MMRLLSCRFSISVTATPLSVVHYTVDVDNASCGLTLSMRTATYSGRLLMNQPAPGLIKPGMSAIARKRCLTVPPSEEPGAMKWCRYLRAAADAI
jgi:hypothetical protein